MDRRRGALGPGGGYEKAERPSPVLEGFLPGTSWQCLLRSWLCGP